MTAILVPLCLFVIGFFVLVKGANVLVQGGASIARIFGMSPWFIGMVILGIGTSIPEFAITIASVLDGNSVGVATVFGSTTFSLLCILGVAAIFMPLEFRKAWVVRDIPIFLFSIAVTILVFMVPMADARISRVEGLILTCFLVLWIYFMLHPNDTEETDIEPQVFTWATSVLYIMLGCIGVFLGGKWVVDGASALALLVGVTPELIGFTVLSFGTSLPEIAIAIAAIRSRYIGLAIGTLIGSNIFDFFGIFGITALVVPISFDPAIAIDMFVAFFAMLILFTCLLVGRRSYTISRGEGVFFIVLYLMYFLFLCMRG